MSFKKALKNLKVDKDSEIGQALKKLDEVFAQGEAIDRQILKLKKDKQQNKEDAELMEVVLMHKLNADTRKMEQQN